MAKKKTYTCPYCGKRRFKSKQAMGVHARFCPERKGRRTRDGSIGKLGARKYSRKTRNAGKHTKVDILWRVEDKRGPQVMNFCPSCGLKISSLWMIGDSNEKD